ncbi:hypothetical protein [Tuwongella immobilis]|uniref:Uncharacterized protein n=1 Tax=Tuwongella immobilis TaxID=692036 RepID=A0A6C2YKM1_9BACT|nr:hypothetical protein [Tuwongella immobilis]VIP01976.1 unnamed protein product [Tuwongella immobilis]VTS00015.1 unnamed protein product [Tuwongella immobilis]
MQNDAKLGMILGVGLVLGAAVLFFQRPETTALVTTGPTAVPSALPVATNSPEPTAHAVKPPPGPPRVQVKLTSQWQASP